MKNTQRYLIALIIVFPLTGLADKPVLALVKVPVADASGFQIGSCCKNIEDYYQTLPYAPDTGSYSCLRIHQLLFNDLVTITREYPGGEVSVEMPGFFFLDGLHRKRHDFWMLKKDLVLLSSLPVELHNHIPMAVDFMKPVADYSHNVLILSAPWSDEKTNVTYSVGTRFVRQQEKDTETTYGVTLINPEKKEVISALIPKHKALVYVIKSFDRARRGFMSLIRAWADQKKGFIPYVYGGSSYMVPYQEKSFSKITGIKCDAKATYWDRPLGTIVVPRSGFDCSNMILRAAQMSFMPYYFKNTLALVKYLRPLKLGEKLEEGDLVWYSGHVMVVSDVAKNLLIESIGYESGYGCVHEIPVHKVFSGIQNYEQLVHAHFARQFTHRLNSSGKPWRSVYRVKIFKLSSIQNLKF